MKIAYIILAFNQPEHLKRLVQRLSDSETKFFIHIDKKVNTKPFIESLNLLETANYIFLQRNKVYRGEWSMVEAEIRGLKKGLEDPGNFDYLCLLSGQDYPIKPLSYIKNFLTMNYGKSFLSFTPMPVTNWNWGADGGMDRLTHYFIRVRNYRWEYPSQSPPRGIRPSLFFLFSKIFFKLPRNNPAGIKPFAGASWWILHKETAQYILDFIQKRPDFVNYHKYTESAEEIFFQSILCNAGPEIYSTIENNDLRYVDWTNKDANMGHPEILTMNHRSQISASDALFARKFDPNIDRDILDWIDQNLLDQNEYSDNFSSAPFTV